VLIGAIHAFAEWMLIKPLVCRLFQSVLAVELVQGAV
jgi:hypothetical protein